MEARDEVLRWQRQANNHADGLAKRGARLHPVVERQVDELDVLRSIAKQAAKWAAWQATFQRQTELTDAVAFPEAAAAAQPALRASPSKPASLDQAIRAALVQPARDRAAPFAGHALRIACGSPRALVFCAACGAYATRKPKALLATCPGRAAATGRRGQVEWLEQGQHPLARKQQGFVGDARPATPAIAAALRRIAARRKAKQATQGWIDGPAEPQPSRASILQRYGLSERSLAAAVSDLAFERRARAAERLRKACRE